MKWVTRENASVDRIACPWLIRRFIDPDAEFLYAPRDQVLEVAERDSAHSYEGPGLYAIARGFALLHGTDDHEKIRLETPMYDALYAWCQQETSPA